MLVCKIYNWHKLSLSIVTLQTMNKIERNSFDLDIIVGMFGDSGPAKWRLRRLYKESNDIKWLEFNEDSIFKEDHGHDFAVGRSLLMSPFNAFFTWQTTENHFN